MYRKLDAIDFLLDFEAGYVSGCMTISRSFTMRQGLEKAFKAYNYNIDYSEDHSHELRYLIPNIVGLRDIASPLVVCLFTFSGV